MEKILERLASDSKLGLQTNELVLPAKDEAQSGMFAGKIPEINEKKDITKEEGKKVEKFLEFRNAENTLYSSGRDWGQATIDALRRATTEGKPNKRPSS